MRKCANDKWIDCRRCCPCLTIHMFVYISCLEHMKKRPTTINFNQMDWIKIRTDIFWSVFNKKKTREKMGTFQIRKIKLDRLTEMLSDIFPQKIYADVWPTNDKTHSILFRITTIFPSNDKNNFHRNKMHSPLWKRENDRKCSTRVIFLLKFCSCEKNFVCLISKIKFSIWSDMGQSGYVLLRNEEKSFAEITIGYHRFYFNAFERNWN